MFIQNVVENIIEERNEEDEEIQKEEKQIKVHIMGQVQNQGIVNLKEGARVIDAVEAAGGMTNQADMSKINLAYVLEDGQKIYIPSMEEKEKEVYISKENGDNVITGGKHVTNNAQSKEGKLMVNINTANQSELEQLPGIGAAIASRIIAYRNENGNFKSIEDVKNVSGIGNAKFNNIKEYISIK
ncbi:MAG: helix-hairpin-helix domain-containing protein [Clostridia bacterium]